MEGQSSTSNSFLESYYFSHGSNANDLSFVRHNVVPGNALEHDGRTSMGWIGQSSSGVSSQNQVSLEELNVGSGWFTPGANAGSQRLVERHSEPNNIPILGSVNNSLSSSLVMDGPSTSRSARSDAVPQRIDLNIAYEGNDGDIGQGMGASSSLCPLKPSGSEINQILPARVSSNPVVIPSQTIGYTEEMGDRSGPSSDVQRLSCKRKAPEEASGEVPFGGNSSSNQRAEHYNWQAVPAPHNASASLNIYTPFNNLPNTSQPEQVNPRLGFGMMGVDSSVHQTSSLAGNAESFHRNIRMRRSSANQQDSTPASISLFGTSVTNSHVQSPNQSSAVSPLHRYSDLRPVAVAANATSGVQPLVHVPSTSQTMQPTQWNRITSSGFGDVSSISPIITANGSDALREEESSRHVPRHTSHQSMFVPQNGRGNLEHTIASSSRIGSRADVLLSAPPGFPQRNIAEGTQNHSTAGIHLSSAPPGFPPRNIAEGYEQRLSEIIDQSMRRSAFTVRDVLAAWAGDPRAMQALLRPGALMSRAERQNAVVPPIPPSLQPFVAADRRAALVSELSRTLGLMRWVDTFQHEDGLVDDASVSDEEPEEEYDMHEDMRLDVDNMSYEELLALEEQIGNVSTGLSEEAVLAGMRQHRYHFVTLGSPVDEEPCCICQDEYLDGQELGKLDCGHEFHFDCIKQWLMQKNSCPMCKLTALDVGERNH